MTLERTPPHNLEAENALLGCVMLNPSIYDDAIADGVDASAFYQPQSRLVWEALGALTSDDKHVDLVTLGSLLMERGELETVGGYAWLSTITDCPSSHHNWKAYADILVECAIRRRVIALSAEYSSKAYDTDGTSAESLLGQLKDGLTEAALGSTNRDRLKDGVALADEAVTRAEAIYEASQNPEKGIVTGIYTLDMILRIEPGAVIIIAGRTSTGKTSLAVTIARNVMGNGHPVGIVSLETPGGSLGLRLISGHVRLDGDSFKSGFTQEDFTKLQRGKEWHEQLPIIVSDSPVTSIDMVRSRFRRMVRTHKIELGILDYLQLVPGGGKYGSREQEVAHVSRSLKLLALELNIPLLVLSQLNREADGNRPTLRHLRESGSIEQDADAVVLLHTKEDIADTRHVPVTAIVAKQRDGRKGEAAMVFHSQFTLFEAETPEGIL